MASPRTPIEAWPARRRSGRPGYSGRKLEALAGAQDDPLRVAERIVARADAELIREQAERMRAAGEPFGKILGYQSRALGEASERRWRKLSESFDLVIGVLETTEQTPAIRALLNQAVRAARAAERAAQAPKRPMFKDLSDAALLEAYLSTKALAHNGAAIKSPKLGRLLSDLDIIVAVARKRGLQLPAVGTTFPEQKQ